MIKTVLGAVTPDALGVTLTHEHLSMQFEVATTSPSAFHHLQDAPLSLENLWWIRQNPYSHLKNLQLKEEKPALLDEIRFYKENGGSAIVENTTNGIDRDLAFMVEASKRTGVHIIAGTGYYVDATHPADMKTRSRESLSEEMRGELMDGVKVGDEQVMCGVIGELGCSWPLTANESKVLQASAHCQETLNCPVIIHPGRSKDAPFEIMRIFQEAGGRASKTVMSHLDRTFFNQEDLLTYAELGSYCEYDLFGIEVSHYQLDEATDMPSDAERIQRIKLLLDEGYQDRLLVAHDIHTKHRLMKYGGHGYSHILLNVVPKMRTRGISDQTIDAILTQNPRRWLTF